MEVNDAFEVDGGDRNPNCSELRGKGKKYIGFLSTRCFPPNLFLLSGLATRTPFFLLFNLRNKWVIFLQKILKDTGTLILLRCYLSSLANTVSFTAKVVAKFLQ